MGNAIGPPALVIRVLKCLNEFRKRAEEEKIWYSFWFWLEANKMSADSPENLLYEETGRTGPELEEDEIDQPQAVLVILDSTEILNLVQ